MDEQTPVRILTKVVLKKYDGDPPQEGEEKEPVETIEIIEEGFPPELLKGGE